MEVTWVCMDHKLSGWILTTTDLYDVV